MRWDLAVSHAADVAWIAYVDTRSFVRLLISSCLTLQPSLSLSLPPTPCSTARRCTAGACLRGRPSLATLLSSSTPEKLCRMLWQASHLGDSWEGTCLLRTATCTVCAFIIEHTGEVAPHSVAGEHWQHMAWTIALHAPPRHPWIAIRAVERVTVPAAATC